MQEATMWKCASVLLPQETYNRVVNVRDELYPGKKLSTVYRELIAVGLNRAESKIARRMG